MANPPTDSSPDLRYIGRMLGQAEHARVAGRLDHAEELAQRVLLAWPGQAQALHLLGLVAFSRGNRDTALTFLRRATQAPGARPVFYSNLAEVCRRYELLDEGERAGRRAVELDPGFPGAWNNLGIILQEAGKLDESQACLGHVVELQPENAEAHNNLANTCMKLELFEQAEFHWRKALQLRPDYPEALTNIIGLLSQQGHQTSALKCARRALELNPRSASGWYNLAELTEFQSRDRDIEAMERLLAPPPEGVRSPSDQTLLHFALGKAYLDIGDSDAAFAHFDTGNRMKRQTFRYDSASNAKWMASISEVFTPELMERLSGAGAPSPVPVFVVGMPRSGTTLTEQILASHSAIRGAGELKYLHRIANSAGEFPASIVELDRLRLSQMGRAYLGHVEPLIEGNRHVVDKMPHNFYYVGLIRLILPDARIIHCRRDPVDTCLSCYTKLFSEGQVSTYDQRELGAFYTAYSRLMAHWRELLPDSRFIEVQYEDMVEDTEGQARRLLDFLDLPWEEACLEFYRTERPVRTASVNQVRKPVYRTSTGRWRKHARNLGPLLNALGISAE